jgi:hypothetical protein
MQSSNLITEANDPKFEKTSPLGLQRCDAVSPEVQTPMFRRICLHFQKSSSPKRMLLDPEDDDNMNLLNI